MISRRSLLDTEISSFDYDFKSVIRDTFILEGDIEASKEEREAARRRIEDSEEARKYGRREYLNYEF